MKKSKFFIPLGAATIFLCWVAGSQVRADNKQEETPDVHTRAIAAAANDFLNSLTADQRKVTQMDFERPKVALATQFNMANFQGGRAKGGGRPDKDTAHHDTGSSGNEKKNGPPSSGEQYGKAVWSNFPINITPRPGIELGSLSAKGRASAVRLLKLLLSPEGYQKVEEIMGSDQALAEAGTDVTAGAAHYLIGIFGSPDATKPWMVEFGGHHLGLNIVVAGSQGALTPTLTGAQPSVYQVKGKTVRALAAENDLAFDLLNALDEKERKSAMLDYVVGDLVLGPGHDGETIIPEGIKASAMSANQKKILLRLISQWAGIINGAYAKARIKEIETGIDSTYFAWSGPTTYKAGQNGTAYYRIQGPHVIIEFSPQGTFGDASVHVHTIYRDPLNSYGKQFTAQ